MKHSKPPPHLRKPARAAGLNPAGRFEPHDREHVHDGWDIAEDPSLLRTEVRTERPRSAITRNSSPDLPFDRSINPYRGCEHGCIYCFARPTHAFLGLSPGLDFETRLIARPGLSEQLARELSRPKYTPDVIAIGTNTDPYQPIEVEHRIMRDCLQVLSDFNHPVGIVTKGAMITRDLDILSDMAARGLVHVGISVTTLDADLSRRMEPRVPTPDKRLQTIRALTDAGVPVRVMASPMIPVLTDHELEAILQAGAEAGAQAASWILLRLPLEVAPLFKDWLEAQFPDSAAHVMNRMREMRGGADYDAEWGKRMRGQGQHAELLAARFQIACRRFGLLRDLPPLRRDLFARPPRAGDQLSLF